MLEPAMQLAMAPGRNTAEYNYVMTGKVRMLLFWVGADDVGGGYIRRGVSLSSPARPFIQVLFGSDPAKAPRHINHWGSAIEASGPSSAVFGFMKKANTASPEAAQEEIAKQQEKGENAFEAIASVVDNGRAISRVVPMLLDTDFNIHQFEKAQKAAMERLRQDGPIRELDPQKRKCKNARGFLQAVDELAQRALATKVVPLSACYVYNARDYTLTLRKRSAIKSKEVEFKLKTGKRVVRNYDNLVLAEFETFNHQSDEQTEFELMLGASGNLTGVPIQITYQPNFWLKVILNLENAR